VNEPNRTRPAPTFLDRIDACSALAGGDRAHAALLLHLELLAATGITALTWRAMGIELGACSQLFPVDTNAHEILRSRSVDAHSRADAVGRAAMAVRQLIPVVVL
jgi:hypothetical protein